jgi:hypothetical protein
VFATPFVADNEALKVAALLPLRIADLLIFFDLRGNQMRQRPLPFHRAFDTAAILDCDNTIGAGLRDTDRRG